MKILVTGATGSIGRHVVDEAIGQVHEVRALVRGPGKLKPRPGLEIVVADLIQPPTLAIAVEGLDAVVFTHGTYGSPRDAETVDYGGVRNVLLALGDRPARIVLMTAIAVTDRKGAHDWKRRAERLVRLSRRPYTIVRPGWFDYNEPDQRLLHFLQGDRRQSGTPRDGVIARRQVARVLVDSLTSEAAIRKTLELVAERGAEQEDLDPLFAALATDDIGSLDAVRDVPNMPLEEEPPLMALAKALVPGPRRCGPRT